MIKTGRSLNRFTIVELLVVISVIAILAALLLPALNSAREKAQEIKCIGNMKQLGTAWALYEDAFTVTPQIYVNGISGPGRGWYGQLYLGGFLKPNIRRVVFDGVSAVNCFTLRCDVSFRLVGPDHPRNYGCNALIPQKVFKITESNYAVSKTLSYKSSAVFQPSQRIRVGESMDWVCTQSPVSDTMGKFVPNAYTLISYPHQRFTMSNFLFVDGHAGGMKHPYMLTVKARKLHLASNGL